MDIAKDIVDKYTTEQVIAHLDHLMSGVTQNFRTGLKVCKSEPLWISMGDIEQVKEILHEMKTRNDAREAAKDMIK